MMDVWMRARNLFSYFQKQMKSLKSIRIYNDFLATSS